MKVKTGVFKGLMVEQGDHEWLVRQADQFFAWDKVMMELEKTEPLKRSSQWYSSYNNASISRRNKKQNILEFLNSHCKGAAADRAKRELFGNDW